MAAGPGRSDVLLRVERADPALPNMGLQRRGGCGRFRWRCFPAPRPGRIPIVSTVAPPHVNLDERGVAWIDDTNVKVIEVVLDRLAYGWSPEEIHFQHPDLSLGQIHAALAYYYDHQAELDKVIASESEHVRRLRDAAAESPLVTRLKANGLLR